MEYITVGEAARRWGVTERRVQHFCAEGRVPGAERFGRAWRIPAGAVKPDDPRRLRRDPRNDAVPSPPRGGCAALMPLMGSPFRPGHAREFAESLDPGPRRDVALAELAYFTGDAAEAARLARPLLQATDGAARLSACLIFSYASLALGRINDARATLARARGALGENIVGGGYRLSWKPPRRSWRRRRACSCICPSRRACRPRPTPSPSCRRACASLPAT